MKKILVAFLLLAAPAYAEGDPWIGLLLEQHGSFGGTHVREVIAGSPGDKAGIKSGDEVLAFDERATPSSQALIGEVKRAGVGHAVKLRVVDAGGHTRMVTLKLEGRPDPDEMQRSALIGHAAPDFEPVVQAGAKLPRLSSLKGKVVLIDFFATWCGPCVQAMPHLEELHHRLEKKGLEVLGVSTESARVVAGAAAHFHLSYTLASDENEGISSSYRVFALPTMVLIDRQGIVREVSIADVDAIDAAVARALK